MENLGVEEIKQLIIDAGYKAVSELIKVAEEAIVTNTEDDVSVDRLKNAAATKKLAIFDAFEILSRLEEEKQNIEANKGIDSSSHTLNFAEARVK
jgi:hypothetical protein